MKEFNDREEADSYLSYRGKGLLYVEHEGKFYYYTDKDNFRESMPHHDWAYNYNHYLICEWFKISPNKKTKFWQELFPIKNKRELPKEIADKLGCFNDNFKYLTNDSIFQEYVAGYYCYENDKKQKKNYFREIKFLLENGANANWLYPYALDRIPTFWLAIENNDIKLLKLFLKHGAIIDTPSEEGYNCLRCHCSPLMESYLLAKGVKKIPRYKMYGQEYDGTPYIGR